MTPEPAQMTLNCQTIVHHELDGILSQSSMSHSQIIEMSANQKTLFIGASHTKIVVFKISSMLNANQSKQF